MMHLKTSSILRLTALFAILAQYIWASSSKQDRGAVYADVLKVRADDPSIDDLGKTQHPHSAGAGGGTFTSNSGQVNRTLTMRFTQVLNPHVLRLTMVYHWDGKKQQVVGSPPPELPNASNNFFFHNVTINNQTSSSVSATVRINWVWDFFETIATVRCAFYWNEEFTASGGHFIDGPYAWNGPCTYIPNHASVIVVFGPNAYTVDITKP